VLAPIPTKSLKLTNEVLSERRKLETTVSMLRPQIAEGLNKLEAARDLVKTIKTHRLLVDQCSKFEISTQVPKIEKQELAPGVHTTTCMHCNRTCHENCAYADNNAKASCSAMREGVCTVCPNHCHWNQHTNQPFIYIYTTENKKIRSQDLYTKYVDYKSKASASEQVLRGLIDEFLFVQAQVAQNVATVTRCLDRLRQIALLGDPLSVGDYMDLMIEAEKAEKKAGWKERIRQIETIKEEKNFLKSVGTKDYDPFKGLAQKVEGLLQEILHDNRPKTKTKTKLTTTTTTTAKKSMFQSLSEFILGDDMMYP